MTDEAPKPLTLEEERRMRGCVGLDFPVESILRLFATTDALRAELAAEKAKVDQLERKLAEAEIKSDVFHAAHKNLQELVVLETVNGQDAPLKVKELEGSLERATEATMQTLERNEELARELAAERIAREQLEVQLSGCGAAALDGSPEQEAKPGDYGYSASYGDVLRMRRELELSRKVVKAARLWPYPGDSLSEALAAYDKEHGNG